MRLDSGPRAADDPGMSEIDTIGRPAGMAAEGAAGAGAPLWRGSGLPQLALAFALALFVVSSLVWWPAGADPLVTAPAKMIAILGDALLAAAITFVLWKMQRFRLGTKALVGCAMALALSPISALIDWGLHAWFVYPARVPFDPGYFAQVIVYTTSELFGWSCLYLALDYSNRTRQSERRLAQLRQEALSAQMRALQYQVNPHFLFNTLNSIAGLIEEGASEPAAAMVTHLAAYLRRTLELDPMGEVSLLQEIELQLEYLHIEQMRFAGRLELDVRLDPDVAQVPVPPLILQPLVENAIKHGVSQVPGRSTLTIAAAAGPDGRLHIRVENALPEGETAASDGLGIGLANVRSRLEARSPGAAGLDVTPIGGGRMRVEITLPGAR